MSVEQKRVSMRKSLLWEFLTVGKVVYSTFIAKLDEIKVLDIQIFFLRTD